MSLDANPLSRALLALGMGLACLWGCAEREDAAGLPQPDAGVYAGSSSCADCHPEAYAAWSGSHHDLAMQRADDDTVLGDFTDVSFEHFGVVSRFFRRGDDFRVETEGPDGKIASFRIAYTFGVDPLQQYLIEMSGGRMQTLGIAWDSRSQAAGGQRWFHLYPDERIAHDDPLHWTGRYQTWNAMCAECHSTNLRRAYDPAADRYETTWSEIDVACEACHGAGAPHVAWARDGAGDDPGFGVSLVAAGDEVEACARCHARRHAVSPEDERGRPLLDDFMPASLREGFYHADGQILDEVYVYGSFLQSRMARRGVRCSDCHEPHSLALRAEGDALCLRCHSERPDPNFSMPDPKRYDVREHHFHDPATEAARCVSCHMLERTYMGVDPRRDHSFRIPRPDLSATLGTPNTCNDCHRDRSSEWAAAAVVRNRRPGYHPGSHYGEVLAAGRSGDPAAIASLIELVAADDEAGIVRATALELLARFGSGSPGSENAGVAGAVAAAAADPDPLLRATAAASLELLPPDDRHPGLPLLRDSVRAVRIHAARSLASLPTAELAPEQRRALAAGLREYDETQRAASDLPTGWLNRALLHAARNEPEQAVEAYRAALRLDPYFLPARSNLAMLYNELGRNRESEAQLREAVRRHPDVGDVHYSLGLLLAEDKRLSEAAEALGRAAELLPNRFRVHYNHALALQHLGHTPAAEAAYDSAYRLAPADPALLRALASFYAQRRHWQRAESYVRAWIDVAPASPEPHQLLEYLLRQQASARTGGDPAAGAH